MGHPGVMRGSRGTSAALWVLFAAVAVVSGWIAVQMVGGAVTPASVPVLTAGEVAQRLATASPAATSRPEPSSTKPQQSAGPSAKPSGGPSGTTTAKATSSTTSRPRPSATSAPGADSVVRTLVSRGGSVVAACASGRITLRSWSPAVGFRVDEVERGPDEEAEIKFVSSSTEVQMKVRCVSGVPSAETEVDDESGDDD